MGFLEFPTPLYFVMELGAFSESLLFSIALAFRVPKNVQERQRAQEQLLKQMQATESFKNQFLANTSHELKTPLHGIMGLAENLLTEARQRGMQQMSETLHLMIQSGRRLNLLINNLLDQAALRENRLTLHPELCYLQPLVRSAVDLVNVQFSTKKQNPFLTARKLDCPRVECGFNTSITPQNRSIKPAFLPLPTSIFLPKNKTPF